MKKENTTEPLSGSRKEELEHGDAPDGVTETVSEMAHYLKQIVEWGKTVLMSIIALSLICILIYNFFAPSEKDVSQQTINKLLSALNENPLPIDFTPKLRNLSEWKNN